MARRTTRKAPAPAAATPMAGQPELVVVQHVDGQDFQREEHDEDRDGIHHRIVNLGQSHRYRLLSYRSVS